jgi:hypothetical protein
MMLMSAMGPMGIAIGIAIDEGIAKEIDAAAKKAGFSIEPMVEAAFRQTWRESTSANSLVIQVKRYGFHLQPGKNDPVSVFFVMEVSKKKVSQFY